ncbi:hypothetical protein FQN57_001536 [Myotisia sp. PD_48]|nr:hypothetical protein FQN57_001536 [Myotisia sp. PD_48]
MRRTKIIKSEIKKRIRKGDTLFEDKEWKKAAKEYQKAYSTVTAFKRKISRKEHHRLEKYRRRSVYCTRSKLCCSLALDIVTENHHRLPDTRKLKALAKTVDRMKQRYSDDTKLLRKIRRLYRLLDDNEKAQELYTEIKDKEAESKQQRADKRQERRNRRHNVNAPDPPAPEMENEAGPEDSDGEQGSDNEETATLEEAEEAGLNSELDNAEETERKLLEGNV